DHADVGRPETTMRAVEPTRTSIFLDRLFGVVTAPVWIPVLLVLLGSFYVGVRLPLRYRVERTWVARGRRMIVVYSSNPLWQPYIESNWLPRLGEQAVFCEWSGRRNAKHAK